MQQITFQCSSTGASSDFPNSSIYQMGSTAVYTGAATSNAGNLSQFQFGLTSETTGQVVITGWSGSTVNFAPAMTPEQVAAMEAEQARWIAECAVQQKKRDKADKVAVRLLKETVGQRQYASYRKRGFFELIGESGKRYRLHKGRRVQIMKESFGDAVDYELCIVHASEYVPPTDTLLTLLLLILAGQQGEQVLHEKGNRRAA